MPSSRRAQLNNMLGHKSFPSRLPSWDREVPNLDLAADRTKATCRYYGFEPVPGKPGFIRDFVELGPGGVEEHLPEALCVPQTYCVPLCMVNWSISVNQYLRGRMVELAGSSSSKTRKAKCVEFESTCLQRLWWYVRCRDHIRADIQSDPQPDIVGSLNELLWREWNNWISEGPPENEISSGVAVQKMMIGQLFASGGGFIGALSFVHA